MNRFQECKNIKEIVQNISYDVCFKISFYSILVYFLIPLLSMGTNVFIKGSSTMYLYVGLFLFGFIGLLNGSIYFFKKYYEDKINNRVLVPIIIILIFFIWSFISSLLSSNKIFAFVGTWYRHDGYISYIFYLGFLIHGFIVSHNKKSLKILLNILVISSTIMCFLILINNKFTDILIKGINLYSSDLDVGIFSQRNHFGYYLTICICASFSFFVNSSRKNVMFYLLTYILLLYTLTKNDTFGCFLAVSSSVICLFVYTIIKKKNIIKSILVLIIISIFMFSFSTIRNNIFNTSNEAINIGQNINNIDKMDEIISTNGRLLLCAGTNRFDLWINGIKLIGNKPLFGYGFENLAEPYSKVLKCELTDRPHNIFIQLGANIGIMGIVLYVAFLGIIFINLLKKFKYIDPIIMCFAFMSIGYIVSSMFGNSMFYTSPYYMVSLGVIMSVYFFRRDEVNDR